MPEVGLGVGLERFALLARGEVECIVDIVDSDAASLRLTSLPDFPLALEERMRDANAFCERIMADAPHLAAMLAPVAAALTKSAASLAEGQE